MSTASFVTNSISARRLVRLIARCWAWDLKHLSASGFFILVALVQPVIFATIAFFMFKVGDRSGTLLYAALGAGMMGIWSATLFGSGGLIQWERWQGTLELLIGAPVPFVLVLIPATLATSSVGVYSITATLFWGWTVFDIPFELVHPLAFFISVPVTILGLGLMGLLLASTFVLYRHANAMSNLLEYPVWLVSGLLVPVTLLPSWVEPLGYILAPSWGIKAVRAAALGGDPWPPMAMTILLGIAYLFLGAFFLKHFERLARERATLALT